MAQLEDKLNALASFKGVDVSEITYDGDMSDPWDEYEVDGESYIVCTPEEADQLLRDDIENFIDDLGLAFTDEFNEWIIDNALIESDWFEEACQESNEFYASDIASESGEHGSRLNDECIEAGIISEEDIDEDGNYIGDLDLEQELADYITEDIGDSYDSYFEWYRSEFGDDNIRTLITQGQLTFDIDKIADEVYNWDGYGNNLAKYDGVENEENGFYIFRQN